MSILHKLMEKKDLKNYLTFRIKQLNHNIRKVPDHVKKENRNEVIERLKARREELERLNHALSQDDIKGKSKDMWRYLYEQGEVEYDIQEQTFVPMNGSFGNFSERAFNISGGPTSDQERGK